MIQRHKIARYGSHYNIRMHRWRKIMTFFIFCLYVTCKSKLKIVLLLYTKLKRAAIVLKIFLAKSRYPSKQKLLPLQSVCTSSWNWKGHVFIIFFWTRKVLLHSNNDIFFCCRRSYIILLNSKNETLNSIVEAFKVDFN